jgi:hypothetical protein
MTWYVSRKDRSGRGIVERECTDCGFSPHDALNPSCVGNNEIPKGMALRTASCHPPQYRETVLTGHGDPSACTERHPKFGLFPASQHREQTQLSDV